MLDDAIVDLALDMGLGSGDEARTAGAGGFCPNSDVVSAGVLKKLLGGPQAHADKVSESLGGDEEASVLVAEVQEQMKVGRVVQVALVDDDVRHMALEHHAAVELDLLVERGGGDRKSTR